MPFSFSKVIKTSSFCVTPGSEWGWPKGSMCWACTSLCSPRAGVMPRVSTPLGTTLPLGLVSTCYPRLHKFTDLLEKWLCHSFMLKSVLLHCRPINMAWKSWWWNKKDVSKDIMMTATAHMARLTNELPDTRGQLWFTTLWTDLSATANLLTEHHTVVL